MPRKISKKGLTVKLDKIVSKLIRARGYCVKCGNDDYEKLQAAHIYSRTYRSVRWYLDNILCLCVGCHFWGHKNPILFTEFVQERLGPYRYEELKLAANEIKKRTVVDMQDLYKHMESLYEREVDLGCTS